MASGLFALLDDIASVLDDVAALTKVAAQKTAGVLGDDLALNAQQLNGLAAEREWPVVWAVAQGSLLNKLVLVPLAVALSFFVPWSITPLLMLGGAYLCLEGFEKIAHALQRRWTAAGSAAARPAVLAPAAVAPDAPDASLAPPPTPGAPAPDAAVAADASLPDLRALERARVRGAIRTDLVLSGEIIAITLSTVQSQPWAVQLAVLAGVGLLMTVGVYGFVACIVKLDDLGYYLYRQSPGLWFWRQRLARALLASAPWMMRALTVLGTLAVFVVGGGILLHGLHQPAWAIPWLAEALCGVLCGALLFALGAGLRRLTGRGAGDHA